MSGFFGGWFDPEISGGTTTPPTISLISPVDFSDDFAVASQTPVVIDVIDDVGLGSVVITASGAGMTGTQLVYGGTLVAPFLAGSSRTSIPGGYRFSILLDGGWRAGELDLVVLATDTDGNQAFSALTWSIDPAEAGDDLSGVAPFRDSVWRWRRRLHRQKCSVISVSIDDDYTAGPGFVLNALSLEIGRKPGLDRVVWRAGGDINTAGSGNSSDGT